MTTKHGRAGVPAHPHRGKAVLGAHVMHDAQAEPNRRCGVAGSEHGRIANALDLLSLMLGQQPAHGDVEPVDQIDGLLAEGSRLPSANPPSS